ncbi:trypco2 family protein [Streptomyces sp. JJ36]|uniref:trypco2 family protein n=1 Tax=Streptomyces sp. JJ36 TaxID=2736645 RepID=UPI001F1783DD|nr:trypco2 family protein [Streptomyces sp. JJ36]MCF6524259.1 hypothetical protein [Streptomyces sp. JJ36]
MDIELADLLRALRREIGRAQLDAAGEDVRFRIDDVELELQVAVERTREADAGVRFWVVSLGGKGTKTSTDTHVVRLSLSAETASGGPVFTGDDVSGLLAGD